uniref:Uncharacterized protein n=1 Tax=Siphoviridae sp. ctXzK3 TaxID=2827889 RepID=A0A8S5SVB8_9CAUD|nr:MAG TPA: hypothetical protein [Siphoviridae sp. ctXzK3]
MKNKSVPENDFFEKISDILLLPQKGGDNNGNCFKRPTVHCGNRICNRNISENVT